MAANRSPHSDRAVRATSVDPDHEPGRRRAVSASDRAVGDGKVAVAGREHHRGHADMPGFDVPPILDLGATQDMNRVAMDQTGMDHGSTGDHGAMGHDMSDPAMAAAMERDISRRFWVALALTLFTVLISPIGAGISGRFLPAGFPTAWIMFALTTPVVFWCGSMFITGAVSALRVRVLDMNVLIATGVLAAYLASVVLLLIGGDDVFFEAAAMLVTFVLFGHWMEMKSRRGTSDALRALFDLTPPLATVIRNGSELEIPTAEIMVGETVVIRPGDKIPVDGDVLTGETSINESLITGESLPVEKRAGERVIAGSVNQSGAITFRATGVGADTTLARIVALVQHAQASRAPGQRLADKAAQYLVVLAVSAGLVTFIAWCWFGGADFVAALTFAISAVVIACPDALGLATPTAVAVGTGIAARHNILIKDAATLEGLAGMQAIVLDKTGTLTEGKPSLVSVVPLGPWNENDLLALAAAAERDSEHPLSRAIVEGAANRGITVPAADRFTSVAGHGVEAVVSGKTVLVGNPKLLRERGVDPSELDAEAARLAGEGQTPVLIAVDGKLAGLVGLADAIKPGAKAAIERLLAAGIEPVMITGDNRRTAGVVAKQLGISRFHAETLPEDKARFVAELQAQGKKTGMVGDGVNDAPALATADISIAIGAGADVAIEAANVVLMRSDPLDISRALQLSRATVRKMKQNLVWASVYNILAIPIAAGVLYPRFGVAPRPEWSALLMSLSSIIVALNAVLLKRVDRQLN